MQGVTPQPKAKGTPQVEALEEEVGLPWGSNEEMINAMECEKMRDALKTCLESRGFTGPKDAGQCLQYLFTDEFRLCLHNSE